MFQIAFYIPRELRNPVVLSGGWNAAFSALRMLVPEAPMHENYFSVAWKNDIWLAWKIF